MARRSIEQIIDQQVRSWDLKRRTRNAPADTYMPVICVSREVGSGGERVAVEIAKRMDLSYFDREIIEEVAQSARLSEQVIESLDEHARINLANWFDLLVSSRHITPDQYVEHLYKVVGAIGEHGGAVILGRGAGFILPRERCLRVRCVAPLPVRIKRYAEQHVLPLEQARKHVEQADRERGEFIRDAFGADCECALNYDLIMNTETFTPVLVAETVYRSIRELLQEVDLEGHRRHRGQPAATA